MSLKPDLLKKLTLALLIVWLVAAYVLFATIVTLMGDPKMRAMLGMVSGLIVLWVAGGGIIMYTLRDRVKDLVRRIPVDWRLKFVAFATLLALIEEAVTTGMTNLAPLLGVKMGEAYITASANYLDVVMFHSVIVFIPMFLAWAWLLSRYDFKPFSVFLLFGFTGMLAESISVGLQNVILFGMWVFVYGLMVYLPAYSLPGDRSLSAPKFRHYVLAILLPFIAAIPVAIIVMMIHPVAIHF